MYILKMKNICKEFPGVKALNNVNLNIKRGEIHALCGENGAGKSTLMKILGGVYSYKSYRGDIIINDKIMQFSDVRASEKSGIAIIYQELALVPELDVAENIFLGNMNNIAGVINWDNIYNSAQKLLKKLKLNIPLDKKIKDLGIGQQQLVEIIKALSWNADLLILDEPTTALTETEVDLLLEILRNLKASGVTCIVISHKLDEVFSIADRVTVLRDGTTVGSYDIASVTEEKIISLMVGRDLTQIYPSKEHIVSNKFVFEVKNFSVFSRKNNSKKILNNINFSVRHNEILGIAGLMGAGRTALLNSLFGFMQEKKQGEMFLEGEKIHIQDPYTAIRHRVGMVTEDRKRFGLVLIQNIILNITLASLKSVSLYGVINNNEEIIETNRYVNTLGIKTPSIESIVSNLSGGNQQKVLLARSLMTKPKILFLDEPTRGIDVGAKYEIYTLMNKMVKQGTSIIMVSSELSEVLGMSDRILVMREGEITGQFLRSEASQEKIMLKASGGLK